MNGELILILGGARAGKSAYALRLAREREAAVSGGVCFIATAEASDDDMRARIARHRAERPAHWRTIEEPRRLDAALAQARDASVVIVDCLTLCVSNWMVNNGQGDRIEQAVIEVMERALAAAAPVAQTVILVSNEVGLGLVPTTPLGRAFRDLLGQVNQQAAQAASRVYLMVAGLPVPLKPGFQGVSHEPGH